MAATLLPEGKQSFQTASGTPAVGWKLATFLAGTNTPATTWQDANQAAPNTNPIIMDARGECSVFFDGAYKLVLRDNLDNVIWTQDNVVTASYSLAGSTGSSLIGFLQFGPGAALRTVQAKLRETISVKDFGAVGNNVADDTAALQAAFNSAATAPRFGGIVLVPNGNYRYTSLSVPDGVSVVGEGEFCSILTCTSLAGAITMGASSSLRRLRVTEGGARTIGPPLVEIDLNGVRLEEIVFQDYTCAVKVGVISGALAVDASLFKVTLRNGKPGTGSFGIYLANFANASVISCLGTGPAAGNQPDSALRINNGDTFFVSDCNFTRLGYGLLMDVPGGLNCYAGRIIGCLFDSAGTLANGTLASAGFIGDAGHIYNLTIADTWFGLSAASGLVVQGNVDGMWLNGNEYMGNANSGLLIISSGVINWSAVGGGAGGNGYAGYRITAASIAWSITNVRSGNVAGRGANGRGLVVEAVAADYYTLSNNVLTGNTVTNLIDSGTGINKYVPAGGNLV